MPIIKHLKHVVENFVAYQENIKTRSANYKDCLTDVKAIYERIKNIKAVLEFDSF